MEPLYLNETYINGLLESKSSEAEQMRILEKARQMKGLTPQETAALLTMDSATGWKQAFEIAGEIKSHIYGDRVVMFAPLYISDYCVNECVYCGFSKHQMKDIHKRRKLSMEEIRQEVELLERMGHKRLALEAGEDPINCPLSYVLEAIQTIYSMKTENGEIRRVNVNIAALDVDGYKQLKQANIGTYILFQETYNRATYRAMHLSGPKRDFEFHSRAHDRAMEAGLDDVGGGVLFGLHDPFYEVLGMILHNQHLEQNFGVGFHTLSAPRVRSFALFPNAVDDEIFLRLIAVIRMAVPFTGIIISTRENPEMRRRLIKIGVSQISGGSSVEVGGYFKKSKNINKNNANSENNEENDTKYNHKQKLSQFQLEDGRTPSDILMWLMEEDLIPSFCTACYRKSRTGDRFMKLAKSGDIKDVCLPNALMTLAEYAMDYGTDELKKKAFDLIKRKVDKMEENSIRTQLDRNIEKIIAGERDLYV